MKSVVYCPSLLMTRGLRTPSTILLDMGLWHVVSILESGLALLPQLDAYREFCLLPQCRSH